MFFLLLGPPVYQGLQMSKKVMSNYRPWDYGICVNVHICECM